MQRHVYALLLLCTLIHVTKRRKTLFFHFKQLAITHFKKNVAATRYKRNHSYDNNKMSIVSLSFCIHDIRFVQGHYFPEDLTFAILFNRWVVMWSWAPRIGKWKALSGPYHSIAFKSKASAILCYFYTR